MPIEFEEPENVEGPSHRFRDAFVRDWSIPLLYVSVLIVIYLRYGFLFQFTLGAVSLAVFPAISYVGKSREFLRNSAFFVMLLLTYEALQGITGLLVNTGSVLSLAGFDRAIVGFDLSAYVQSTFYSTLTTLASNFFYSLHFLLIVAALVLLWFKDKSLYRRYAYAMVLTSYLALLTFVLVPTAPPWFSGTVQNLVASGAKMLPAGLQNVQQALLAIESDKFAAFPSLHAAYATLFAFYTVRLDRKYALVALPILVGVYFAIIYLGQHYIVDLLGGVAYSMGAVVAIELAMKRYH